MGGDNFNKSEGAILPFGTVTERQSQMNAMHALWLNENAVLENNKDFFSDLSRMITEQASLGSNKIRLSTSAGLFSTGRLNPIVRILNLNGFQVEDQGIRNVSSRPGDFAGNWVEGTTRVKQFMISW